MSFHSVPRTPIFLPSINEPSLLDIHCFRKLLTGHGMLLLQRAEMEK